MSLFLTGVCFPSALSYSALNLQVAGISILDLLDETAGSFGLPLTALLTVIVFAWLLDPVLLREKGGVKGPVPHLILKICRYLIPPVLVVILLVLGVNLLWG